MKGPSWCAVPLSGLSGRGTSMGKQWHFIGLMFYPGPAPDHKVLGYAKTMVFIKLSPQFSPRGENYFRRTLGGGFRICTWMSRHP
ncbi:hypothetical protein K469DRAFT_391072 [Zopfia rhizophila CBS 207.26]|uniref:Uncharacterized protein n=1 Tax=Zopfia rhizophila CBS 207.26 TaxID=1314779 RepID=A0A6A6EIJ4_9PEZI|nr:hypothetical protein K469DRAFT_391072 [Zopfia rhizophila CBS 207.26]